MTRVTFARSLLRRGYSTGYTAARTHLKLEDVLNLKAALITKGKQAK